MASPATAAFLARWRGYSADRRCLIKVQLTDPSTRTLYLATADTRTPDGQLWQGILLDVDVLEAPGEHLSSGFDACSCGFRVAPTRFGYQTLGMNALDSLASFRWIGAAVSFYLWSQGLTSFSDALPVLLNGVVDDYEVDARGMHILCSQRRLTNQALAPEFVQRHKYPKAPDKSFGLPLPIVIGDGRSPGLRGEWGGSNHNADQRRYGMRGGIIPASPCVIVDQGQGGGAGKATVVVAGHAVQSVIESGGNASLAMQPKGGGDPVLLDVTTGGDIYITSPARFDIDDASVFGYAFVPFVDVELQANQGENARHLLDVKEYAFARLDYSASKRAIKLNLASMSNLGTISDVLLVAGYKTNSAADAGQQIEWRNNGVGSTFLNHASGMTSSLTPTTTQSSIGAPGVGNSISVAQAAVWDFSNVDIFISYKAGVWTGSKVDVHWLGVVVKYLPKGDLVRLDRVPNPRYGMPPPGVSDAAARRWSVPKGAQFLERPTIVVDGDYYAQPRGWDDTTVTGGTSPVERPCDIVQLILKQYLGLATLIETTSGVHGNFTDARAKLVTWNGQDMRYFRSIVEAVDIHPLLQDLARQSASWWLLNRFTDKYIWIVWERAPAAADYARTLEPDDMLTPGLLEVNTDGAGAVGTGVRVTYLYDAARKQAIANSWVSPDGSGAGYDWMDIRDEYLSVVTGANDKLDTNIGTTTLDAGDYTPIGLAQHVTTKLGLVFGSPMVSWGFQIVAGFNDKADFSDGSVKVATVAPGIYTGAQFAQALQDAMNAVSSGITVSYDLSTRKITVAKASGTLSIITTTAANKDKSVWPAAGFNHVSKSGSLSYTADYPREPERFSLSRVDNTFDMLWETGTNGLNGTRKNAAELLGFLTLRDATGVSSYMGDSPKRDRETAARLARTRYGGKRELSIDGNWIRDSATARELRNRLFDLTSYAKIRVRFESMRVPDLERGKLIAFSPNFDRFLPFPKGGSDGSWGGKVFYVVDVRQHLGPDRWDTEVTAVEALDTPGPQGWGINYGVGWGPA